MLFICNALDDRLADARQPGQLPDRNPGSQCLPYRCIAFFCRPSADILRIATPAGYSQAFDRFTIRQALCPVIIQMFRLALLTDISQKSVSVQI